MGPTLEIATKDDALTFRPSLLPFPALLLAALAACAPPSGDGSGRPGLFGASGAPEAELPPGPPPLPAAVQAALPPGVPASVVLQDGQGCYLYSIERTEPPSGYPLRDAAGNQVCDPGVVPSGAPIATVAGLAADVASSVPPLAGASPETPALPPARASAAQAAPVASADASSEASDDGLIDIGPVLSAPLPGADVAPDQGEEADIPASGPAIVPGDITPPAPLAPLN